MCFVSRLAPWLLVHVTDVCTEQAIRCLEIAAVITVIPQASFFTIARRPPRCGNDLKGLYMMVAFSNIEYAFTDAIYLRSDKSTFDDDREPVRQKVRPRYSQFPTPPVPGL